MTTGAERSCCGSGKITPASDDLRDISGLRHKIFLLESCLVEFSVRHPCTGATQPPLTHRSRSSSSAQAPSLSSPRLSNYVLF